MRLVRFSIRFALVGSVGPPCCMALLTKCRGQHTRCGFLMQYDHSCVSIDLLRHQSAVGADRLPGVSCLRRMSLWRARTEIPTMGASVSLYHQNWGIVRFGVEGWSSGQSFILECSESLLTWISRLTCPVSRASFVACFGGASTIFAESYSWRKGRPSTNFGAYKPWCREAALRHVPGR